MTGLIKKITTIFFGNIPGENNFSNYVVGSSVQLLLLNGISLALGFAVNYILIRLAGVQTYGSYVYLFNLLYLLVNFCFIGTDMLLVKRVSVYDAAGKFNELKGVIIFGIMIAVLGTMLVTLISQIVVFRTKLANGMGGFSWITLAASALAMLSVLALCQAILQGLKKILLSQLPEKIIKPSLVLLLVGIIFSVQKNISLSQLIALNLAAIGATVLITLVVLKRNIENKIKNVRSAYEIRGWSYSAAGFFLLGMLYVLNSRMDIFLLGLFRGTAEVGVYNIALKITESLSFGLVVVNFVLSPIIARLFAAGEVTQMQQLMTRSAQMVLIFSLPLVLAVFFLKSTILGFFGVNFARAAGAMTILCAGQLVNIFFGSVGTLLLMTGLQRFSVYALAGSTAINLILNIALTPRYGIIGTSIATAASLALWNLLMYYFARKKLKIRTTAFGTI